MNPSVFSGFIGGTGRNQLLSQTLASTTETEIKVGQDTAAGTIAILTIPTGTGIGGSVPPLNFSDNAALINRTGRTWSRPWASGQPAHNSQSFDSGRQFLIRWTGVATPASNAANTLTLTMYNGTSKSGTSLCTTGALTGTETSTQAGAFVMEAQVQWDSVGQILGGQFWYQVLAGATESYHVLAATSYVTAVTLANLNFVITAKWGNAAGGTIASSEFSLSEL
jgi:hypothetical protein